MSSLNKTLGTGQTARGHRCRTNKLICTYGGNVPPSALGTIVREIDNLGRHMLQVRWDRGLCAYVFPHEIELLTTTNQ